MNLPQLFLDALSIGVLVFAVFYPRYRRGDLAVAFIGINAGVFAVTSVLTDSSITAGLGLGLFGVLSIIRLRSSEITQRHVAYYFGALALGLVCAMPTSIVAQASLAATIILSIAVVDLLIIPSTTTVEVHIDKATYGKQLEAMVRDVLGDVTIRDVSIQKIDTVNDLTIASVTYA